jgi:hypothetical protein
VEASGAVLPVDDIAYAVTDLQPVEATAGDGRDRLKDRGLQERVVGFGEHARAMRPAGSASCCLV